MANRFPLIFNSGAGQIQELAASDNLDLTSSNLVNAGILFTSSGSATAPSISIGNGTTYPPGLYSPGTDQLAVATNGVERVEFGASEVVFNDGGTDYDFRVEGDTNANLLFVDASFDTVNFGVSGINNNFRLNVKTGSGNGAMVVVPDTDGTVPLVRSLNAASSISVAEIGTVSGTALYFKTANTECLRLSSTGEFIFKGAGTTPGTDKAVYFSGSAPANSVVLDSSGRLGIGTTNPAARLHSAINDSSTSIAAASPSVFLQNLNTTSGAINSLAFANSGGFSSAAIYTTQTQTGNSGDYLVLTTKTTGGSWNTGVVIDTSNRVGIGTTNVLNLIHGSYTVGINSSEGIRLTDTTNTTTTQLGTTGSSYSYAGVTGHNTMLYGARDIAICADNANNGQIKFATGGSEAFRVDASRRLLVGTGTSPSVGVPASALFVVQGYTGVPTGDSLISLQRGQAPASITSGAQLGGISFGANDGSPYAQIHAATDGAGAANDYPGRLVFSTNPGSPATSPTERVRISKNGVITITGPGSGTVPGYTTESQLTVYSYSNNGASKYSSNDGAQLYLNNSNYSVSGVVDSSQVCKIILNTSAGSYNNGAIIHAEGAGAYNSGQLVFSTGWNSSSLGTERFRIDASGRCLVGIIASPAHALQVSTDSAGKPSTNTWTIVSDERIKEEIQLADLDLCYEAVKNIPLKRFKWKDEVYTEEQVRDRRKLGWIAQDVEAVFPKAVGTYEFKYNQVFEETIIPAVEEVLDDEGNVTTPAQPERIEKGELISEDVIEDCRDLNSDQIYAAMYGAIQKLMVKVETLEAEVALLKAA